MSSRTHGDMFGRDVGEPSMPYYGALTLLKRPVWARMLAVVGPQKKTTRLGDDMAFISELSHYHLHKYLFRLSCDRQCSLIMNRWIPF